MKRTYEHGNSKKKKLRAYQPGQPRFHCDFESCTASFARLEHLKRHKVSHDKSVTFVCEYCDRSFARKDILTRHIRRQHEKTGAEKPALEKKILDEEKDKKVFDYGSPTFTDNSNSPDAILGNSSQVVSQLLNQDFMDWLFAQSPEAQVVQPPMQDSICTDMLQGIGDVDTLDPIPEYMFMEQQEPPLAESAAALEQASPNSCSLQVCNRLRTAMGLDNPSSLVEKYLNPSFITYAVDLYWSLHQRWPILHRPSFHINTCPPYLLVSMITISMYLTRDPDAIELAVLLHEDLRFKVYSEPEFKSGSSVWIFQTLLLAEIFEKMCSTEEQHDLATRFHDVLIASMRRGGGGTTFDPPTTLANTFKTEQDAEWQRFIDHESRKRAAFFAFVVDTQHTILFNHPPSMFISDLRFRLPCDELVWEAPDAESWRRVRNNFPPPPHFTTTISSFLKLDNPAQPQLSPWSMMVSLHGLISVGWNMRLRESVLPEHINTASATGANRYDEEKGQKWVKTISESYNGWLRHYRLAFIVNGKLPFNHPYLLGCLTTYEFAHVILTTDIQELESFVTLLTKFRATNNNNHNNSSRFSIAMTQAASIHRWVRSGHATHALSHALDLIDMFLLGEKQYDVTKETAFHRTWCLYVAALTVWVYHYFVAALKPTVSVGNKATDLRYYLGRMRAILSSSGVKPEIDHDAVAAADQVANNYGVLLEPGTIDNCEANVLLNHVLQVLRPCRWGVMQNRLTLVKRLLAVDRDI